MYLSGARGVNTDFVYPTTYTGFANNSMTSPDSNHIVYGGVATNKASMTSTDKMSTLPIDKAVAYAEMMGGGGPAYSAVPQVQKVEIDGDECYLVVMNPYQKFDLRRNTTTNDWADIQKALAALMGKNSEFIKGGMGMWNGCVLHSHASCIQFSDYGSGAVAAVRALFCGVQSAVIAFGSPGQDLRFGWHEEERDNGNEVVISTHSICGIKKVTFNGNDFGVSAIDTAATKP
jgi:N4-gp56 family major capsid protein